MYYTNKDKFFEIFNYKVYNLCKLHNIYYVFIGR